MVQVVKGKGIIDQTGLRCDATHPSHAGRQCGKLICETNGSHQIAGRFLCARCRQIIEVVIGDQQ